MSTKPSMKALRSANLRNKPDYAAFLARCEGLRTQIAATTPSATHRAERPARRHRLISVSAAVVATIVVAAVAGSLTLGGASPQNAYAAAHKALAATAAQRSGTVALTVNGTTLYTERWNGGKIALKKGASSPLVVGHVLGPNLQMILISGAVYVQGPDGTWTHYASEAALGDKLGPAPYLLRANMDGNTAKEILSVATGLHQTSRPDGTTIYTGIIRNPRVDPQQNLGHDDLTAMLAKLRGEGASDPQAPSGAYPDHSSLAMVVGHDGLVHRISFIFQQPSCQPGIPNCPTSGPAKSPRKTITWSVRYSHLGDNQPITPPTTSTNASTS